jgi:hypothetical protein
LIVLMLLIITLATTGNAIVRGTLACKYCKQKLIGCRADQFFNKDNKAV